MIYVLVALLIFAAAWIVIGLLIAYVQWPKNTLFEKIKFTLCMTFLCLATWSGWLVLIDPLHRGLAR